MGLSSFYCGMIYNEFFALPTEIFDSCYEKTTKIKWLTADDPTANQANFYYPRKSFNCVSSVGVDSIWGMTNTRLNFTNNIKMKLSVIMGVLHMTIGVLCKGTNALFHKDWPTLIFEVITGIIMLIGLFGWMDLLIFGKWFFPNDFSSQVKVVQNGKTEYQGDLWNRKTPSVINILINSVFGFG